MACKYCRHESMSYIHYKDGMNRDVHEAVAEEIPYDDGSIEAAEPMISWCVGKDVLDWADHLPRLAVTAYDADGYESEVSIPIRYCPMCGRKLPTCLEVGE